MRLSYIALALVVGLLTGPFNLAQQPAAPAQPTAQDDAALLQRITDLEDRVVSLEGQLRQMKAPGAQPTAPAAPAPQAAATPPPAPTVQAEPRLGGAGVAAAKALNPDISMIGDFIASTGQNHQFSAPTMEMHESELGVQAIIDPYARGDFFLPFGEVGVNLEEGFIT